MKGEKKGNSVTKEKLSIIGNNKGMTLVEVLVGMAIIAILSLTLMFGFMTMSKVNLEADEFTRADEVLEEAIANDNPSSSAATNIELELPTVDPPAIPPAPFTGVTLPSGVYTFEDPETGKTFTLIGKAP
ncbi:MAG: type II secretion system GspH family protein [Clostridiales Family XIII bacterium]|jgi:prepilin-type N-terminal cleavage/methylation domain-containing protein|nr:type II secretion system GspH family protein [Clostridiales Family XIII bacterium]